MNKPTPSPENARRLEPQLPNLLVIGAMKCGTTSLHEYLDLHPEIFMSDFKELDFFKGDHTWSLGIDWYKTNFATDCQIRGESSQNYSKAHLIKKVPERIHRFIPDVKMIYVVRDPIDRMVSHYYENVESQMVSADESINDILSEFEGNHYIQTSMYFMQIEAFLKFFSKDQILVVDSALLRTERLATMNGVFNFLGVPSVSDPSLFEFRVNTRGSKRVPSAIAKLVRAKASAPLRAMMPRRLKDRLMASKSFERLASRKKTSRQEIDPELAERIREYLKPDMKALREFTGQPFDSWSL